MLRPLFISLCFLLVNALCGQELDTSKPRIFIAGDSTAMNGSSDEQVGWGRELSRFFDTDAVEIVNRARGGRSSRTFTTEGLWGELIAEVREGDLVFIQFGHNDGGPVNDDRRARGSLPGLGRESEAIHNQVTDQEEVVYTFGHYIRAMVSEAKERGARPILVSLTPRNIWEDSRIERGSGQYGWWSYQLAWETNTDFIDLTNTAADKLENLGEPQVAELYPKDHTHFNKDGALLYAREVVSGLKGLRPSVDESWFSEEGKAVEKDDLAWLRLPFAKDRSLPTVFVIGDSTVRNGDGTGLNGQWGWGDFLQDHLDTQKVNVVNRAVGGLSSRTYLTYGHWDRVLGMLRPGDYVVMQFGHNDAADLNDTHRARGTVRGFGEEAVRIENMITGKEETVHSYGWYLRRYIGDALSRGAQPIVCSPIPRKKWDGDSIVRPEDSYPQWAKKVAEQSGVPFIDLYEKAARAYERMGREAVDSLFGDAHTHTSREGAALNAALVAEGLRETRTGRLSELVLPTE